MSFREPIGKIVRIKSAWFLAMALIGHLGCMSGILGYIPLYLRNIGWAPAAADGSLAAFNGASALGVIPVALISDRLGTRKAVLFGAMLIAVIGIGLLPYASEIMVWILVILVGFFRDAFMALFFTLLMETKGIGATYAGTAMGLVSSLGRIGSFLAPPIGNSLADRSPGIPFFFWSAIGCIALVGLMLVKEQKKEPLIVKD